MATKATVVLLLVIGLFLFAIGLMTAVAARQARTTHDTTGLEAALTDTLNQAADRVERQQAELEAYLTEARGAVTSLEVTYAKPVAAETQGAQEDSARPEQEP